MKLVKNEVSDYLSINVTKDEIEWNVANVYNRRDEVRYGNFIYVYAGEDGTNTTLTPQQIWERDKNTYAVWIEDRPTNYYAMLDGKTSTVTTAENELIFELDNNRYDTFALLRVEATTAKIELMDKDTDFVYQIFDFELLDRTDRIDAYTHYFLPIELRSSVYFDNIYLLGNTKLKVTLTNTGGTVKCGRLVFGNSYYLGDTQYGANLDFQSNSRFESDIFGNVSLKQISSQPIESYTVSVETGKIPSIKKKRTEVDATPALFVADESANSNLENLLVFGYFTNFSILADNPTRSTVTINIKGLL